MTRTISTEALELPAVHASIAPVDALLDARRTLYQLAAELLRPEMGSNPLSWDILDSPSFRGRIGKALASGDATVCNDVVPLDAVVTEMSWLRAGRRSIPVAARHDAGVLLSDAVHSVGAELAKQTAIGGSLRLLTEVDGERFTAALKLIADGLTLAWSVSPALVGDLLAHVALMGVVDPESTDKLASASSRSYPGLVLLSPPGSAIEAAEWLVHEAAHQKLFDLAIIGSMLTDESDESPPFEPLWRPMGRRWPLEQTLAAAHAYACMAQFVHDAGGVATFGPLGSGSLLPVARERARTIGDWLIQHGEYLAADAHTLIAGMHGQQPAAAPVRRRPARRTTAGCTVEPGLIVRRCAASNRILVGRRSQPPEMFFVTEQAASLLELLAGLPDDEVVRAFAERHVTTASKAAEHIATLASDMVDLGLISYRR